MARRWFEITNEAATKTAVINIYDKIGKTWTGDDGIAAKEFCDALAQIPSDHSIECHINSRGGNVWDGVTIYEALDRRHDAVTTHVDGVAASIASVIACAGKKCVIGRGGLIMTHPPAALPMDSINADQCRDLAAKLDKHAEAIAAIYARKTGKTKDQCLADMNRGETWMTADDAVKYGLANEISGEDTTAFLNEAQNFDFSQFRRVPDALKDTKKTNTENTMKKLVIDALAKLGVTSIEGVANINDASEEVLVARLQTATRANTPIPAPAPTPAPVAIGLEAQVAAIATQLANDRRNRITVAVDALVTNCQLTADERDRALTRALADETYLAELQIRPQNLPGGRPLAFPAVLTASDSQRNAIKEIVVNLGKPNRGQESFETATDRSRKIGAVYIESRDKVLQVMNAAANNAIDPGLKRQVILQETVRDFAIRVLPLRLFATVFENIALEGTDTIDVGYFPLQAAASQNFVDGDGTGGTGYQFGQQTNTKALQITVQQRKYQPLDYSSNTFRRQPWFKALQLGQMNAEKLGVDILMDVLSVFTPANYPTIAQADPNFNPNLALPGAAYDSNQMDDLKTVATNLNWPDAGRAFICGTTVDNALGKDPAYKLALNIGTTDVIREGKFPRLSGFDYATMPNFPNNGCNLQAVIAFASALAAAFCPIAPAPGVRAQLIAYEIATEPHTGISMNYRHWGLAQADRDFEVIEAAYGYAALLAKAAQLLTHP